MDDDGGVTAALVERKEEENDELCELSSRERFSKFPRAKP